MRVNEPSEGSRSTLEQVSLIARTLVTLQLFERAALADTILSMVATFAEAEHGALLLFEGGELATVAALGDVQACVHEERAALARAAEEGLTSFLSREELSLRAPRLADVFERGLVLATFWGVDRPLGLLLVGARPNPTDEDVAFLSGVSSVAALALINAMAVEQARALGTSLERSVALAKSEASKKSRLLAELQGKLLTIRAQQSEIDEMAFPVLSLTKRVVVAPVIGRLDAERGAVLTDRLLLAVSRSSAEVVILDVTGAIVVGQATADQVVRLTRALRLLGVRVVLTGIQPAVAVALGEDGVLELGDAQTFGSLEAGLRFADALVTS
ncbi:MAG: sensor protein [Labilithrix sp.]|nr:sensor protein [Labilithrix sp.]